MVKGSDPNSFDPMHSPDFLALLAHTGVPSRTPLKQGLIEGLMIDLL